jgi:hypothetical protein
MKITLFRTNENRITQAMEKTMHTRLRFKQGVPCKQKLDETEADPSEYLVEIGNR